MFFLYVDQASLNFFLSRNKVRQINFQVGYISPLYLHKMQALRCSFSPTPAFYGFYDVIYFICDSLKQTEIQAEEIKFNYNEAQYWQSVYLD